MDCVSRPPRIVFCIHEDIPLTFASVLNSQSPLSTSSSEPGPPLAASLSDEACMVRYQQDDAAAFRVLYTRYRDRLFRYVLRLVTRASEAEEIFQEAWLAVIQSKNSYRPSISFAAWLFSIAHHKAADRWRSLKRHAPDWQYAGEEQPRDVTDEYIAAGDTPEHGTHNDHLRKALLDAVQRLPLPQREAFLLKAEGDLSLEDIASITGVPRETVKSRLRYAQQRLRDTLRAWQ